MKKLLPCPFCGEEVKVVSDKCLGSNYYYIKCPTEGCMSEYLTSTNKKMKLIEMWNRRAITNEKQ